MIASGVSIRWQFDECIPRDLKWSRGLVPRLTELAQQLYYPVFLLRCSLTFFSFFFCLLSTTVRPIAVPPAIVESMTSNDMVVREGTNVTLNCKAKGFPEPYVMWRREDGDEMAIGGESGKSSVAGRWYVNGAQCDRSRSPILLHSERRRW